MADAPRGGERQLRKRDLAARGFDASSLMTGSIVLADGGYTCW